MTKRNSKRRTLRKSLWIALPTGMISLLTAGCIEGPLGQFLSLFILMLGVTPSGQFDQNGQVDLNLVQVSEDGKNESASDMGDEEIKVEVTDPPGTEATVDKIETGPVFEKGSFAIILDSSGSMEQSYTSGVCDLCPYDADRLRVKAAQIVIREVLARSPESRVGVFDFGPGASDGFGVTRELAGYTSEEKVASDAVTKTVSDGGTYVYDSVYEVLESMDNDVKESFRTEQVNKAILIITDGEDTESSRSLSEVIDLANKFDIPVNVIGLGKASSAYKELYNTTEENTELIKTLQALARDTGGFYASVSTSQDLEDLGEIVGIALAGGHDKVTVTLDPVPPSGTPVRGTVKGGADPGPAGLFGSSSQWSFVAP